MYISYIHSLVPNFLQLIIIIQIICFLFAVISIYYVGNGKKLSNLFCISFFFRRRSFDLKRNGLIISTNFSNVSHH